MSRLRRALRLLAYAVVWLLLAVGCGAAYFVTSERATSLASHDAVLSPTLSGEVVLLTGPVLPDVRLDRPGLVGVEITLGKTDASSTEALVQRYAHLAGAPEGVERAIRSTVVDLAVSAALRGAATATLPLAVWLLLGAARRRELTRRLPSPTGVVAVGVVAAVVAALWQPWVGDEEDTVAGHWRTLPEFLGEQVPVPAELDGVELRGDVTTAQTRRLITSAIDTYEQSKVWYDDAARAAADLPDADPALRRPAADETVVLLVSDRHDNIGMDRVARAIGEAAGATAVFDAGDDTSTGSSWEGFSLDSLEAELGDLDRWAVTGNHDHGDVVGRTLARHGWEVLDGEVVDGPDGSTLLGVPDPRSSGLGNWREESGLSFTEVGERLADAACEAGGVATLLVHDANLGRQTLERGCAELVVGGHLHVRVGPTAVRGENGEIGHSYTNGTTGGAAYAFALGSKPRREAMVTLLTYRDGHPVGLQPVTLQTNGVFTVGEYVELDSVTVDPAGG